MRNLDRTSMGERNIDAAKKTIDTARQSRSTMKGILFNSTKEAAPTKRRSKSGSAAQKWVPTAQLHHQRAAETIRGTGKCVKSKAGWGQAGSMCEHQHAKNAFVTREAHRKGKRVYQVDIDFRNVFNAKTQATLQHVMNMSHIPDVDLFEQIYESATVSLAENDTESATITFHTGVAQGSMTSSQLFNIFINALLRMLTATRLNQGISHGLQIGKNQEDSIQDTIHCYQFHNIGFIDDISIFAVIPEGRHILLDVVQELTTWCDMEINVKQNFFRNRQGSEAKEKHAAPNLRINGERLKTLYINDTCWYIGYWGTGNGDMSARRKIFREKARLARDLIKS